MATLKYRLNQRFREAEFIKSGVIPEQEQHVEVKDPIEMTEQQRRGWLLVRYGQVPGLASVTWQGVGVDRPEDNHYLTTEEVMQVLTDLPESYNKALKEYREKERIGAEWKRQHDETVARVKEENNRATERYEAEKKAKAAAALEEKMTWIADHGSDFLKTAIASGYNCQHCYVTERVAAEIGEGYTIDWDNKADWKDRSCPSPQVLNEALLVSGKVVWLTHPAHEIDYDNEYDWSHREAVIVTEYLGKYTLVREM